ncbi:MAG TPA: pancreas/duodenum homeobox protein 1 [Desulfobulbaceae bacterium]|nr:MAG: pancreas/duodenum homeobox protein 1 [Deltaproteobacteria bacterium RIFOXYD12_FULL_53_23]HCC54636.1 pancreas/duodenum homeobox protein 1 [Desulfobulbaceae bacterium]
MDSAQDIFTPETLQALFPPERAHAFFDALFGNAEEGAYDIHLIFKEQTADTLTLALELHERPGKCLACNLTYGLPGVFNRHPIINIKGLVTEIDALLGDKATCTDWKLGTTQTVSKKIHVIPLIISLACR